MMEDEVDPLKMEISESNPWINGDPSTFLKYCCPECDYINSELQDFTNHAIENHVNASAMFNHDEIIHMKSECLDSELDFSSDFHFYSERLYEKNNFEPVSSQIENNDNGFEEDHMEKSDPEKNLIESEPLKKVRIGKGKKPKYKKMIKGSFPCTQCSYVLKTNKSLQRHILNGSCYGTKKLLQKHVNSVHEEKSNSDPDS